jgi:hypothetical protein
MSYENKVAAVEAVDIQTSVSFITKRIIEEAERDSIVINKMVFTRKARFAIAKAGHTGLVRVVPLIFATVFAIACAFVLVENKTINFEILIVTLSGILLMILYFLYGYIPRVLFYTRIHKKTYGVAEIVHVNVFREENIDVYAIHSLKQKHFKFDDIDKAIAVSGLLILSTKQNAAIVLDPKSFLQGSLDDLTGLLQKRGIPLAVHRL